MTHFYRAFISFILILSIVACDNKGVIIADHQSDKVEMVADSVYFNGKIYTLEDSNPWVSAVAVKNGIIVYVGDYAGAKIWLDETTIQHDLAGKMLLPGFIDSHAHPVMGGAYVRSLSLDTFASPKKWLEQVANYDEKNPNTEVIFGYGFLASAFAENGPTREMLDKIISNKPVLIMDEGFHGAWANSKALEVLKINQQTADPVAGFSYYKRDKKGMPTGYLLEGTASSAVEQLNIITAESVALGTADVIKIMNSYGITSVFDAGASDVDNLQVSVLDKLAKDGQMTIRLVGSYMVSSVKQLPDAIEVISKKRAQTQRENSHIRMLKIMDDGTIEGKTAGMFVDYQGDPGNKGETVFTQEQINQLVSNATEINIDVHIHALGERAIFESLNAIEFAQQHHPESQSRFTICHVQVITDSDILRFAELDVIAQSTPLWASYDEFGKPFVNDDQFNRYFRFNSFKKAGITLTFGSDFPATGAGTLGMSPIFNMEIGHTRQQAGQKDAPIQPNINERLDIATLIAGYTINGAYQLGLEDEIGSIKVGKKADFVVLDKNLFEVDAYSIHKVKVVQTILNGDVVYKN